MNNIDTENMVKFSIAELSRAKHCENNNGFFGIPGKSANASPLTKYTIVKDTVVSFLKGDIKREEFWDVIESAGELSDIEAQDMAIKKECLSWVNNFLSLTYGKKIMEVDGEKLINKTFPVKLPYLDIDGYVNINPIVIFDDCGEIEVCFLKTGSSYNLKDEFLDRFYPGLLLGRSLVPTKGFRKITSSFIEVKANKIQSFSDDVWPLSSGITDHDVKAKKEWEARQKGCTCKESDCRYCSSRYECKYQLPPIAVLPDDDKNIIQKAKKVILSPAQEAIVNAGLI
ncbi:hypothetical protein SAMN05216391_10967 [Lachnospiraceae bacterium KHCPX20]|nr:hypothetical protein SAMN05216391_10967 [Lachnospiraceae bacterium KHCPX20]